MRTLRTAAFLVAAALASAPAPAFADQPSLTQERENSSQDSDLVWNILGALGIFGLAAGAGRERAHTIVAPASLNALTVSRYSARMSSALGAMSGRKHQSRVVIAPATQTSVF